jgi:hypothetical protein
MDRETRIVGCILFFLLACLCGLLLTGGGTIAAYAVLHLPTSTPYGWSQPTAYISGFTPMPSLTSTLSGPNPDTNGPTLTTVPSEAPSLQLSDPAPAAASETRQTLDQTDPPAGDLLEQAERLKGVTNIPRVITTSAAPIAVGDSAPFNILNMDNNQNYIINAVMRYATPHVYFWVEEGVNARDRDIKQLVDRFENQTYPTDREFFGEEWSPGIDGDVHLYILFARRLGSNVGGYYGSTDEFSRLAAPYSNEHEMFYVNADGQSLSSDFIGGVLAHEFQHMIEWNNDRNEESWMSEGSAELAAFLNNFYLGGFDWSYLSDTDLQLTAWPDINDDSAVSHYGGSFLVMDYFNSRFGPAVTQALVHNTANGLNSIDQTLQEAGILDPDTGQPYTAEAFIADFAATLLVNDPTVQNGRYGFSGYTMPTDVAVTEEVSDCPTAVADRQVSQFGFDYIRIQCPGAGKFYFAGQTTQKVVPVDAAEGQYDVWSNRGDQSDMTLTHAFDIPSTGSTLMDMKVWYDLEQDYDYVYLVASDDNGATWKMVRTPSGTSSSPQGSNLGWGWNGKSGHGNDARWLDEQVDLSDYAGKHILLRFEYVTDAGVNGEGFLVDDIRIPSIGYTAGFEDGLDGWEAQGFARIQNVLPQTFRVLVIRRGAGTPSVQDIALDDRNFGGFEFSVPSGEELYVVVLGTTRYSNQTAEYQYQILN